MPNYLIRDTRTGEVVDNDYLSLNAALAALVLLRSRNGNFYALEGTPQ